jgi:hypothetical protein
MGARIILFAFLSVAHFRVLPLYASEVHLPALVSTSGVSRQDKVRIQPVRPFERRKTDKNNSDSIGERILQQQDRQRYLSDGAEVRSLTYPQIPIHIHSENIWQRSGMHTSITCVFTSRDISLQAEDITWTHLIKEWLAPWDVESGGHGITAQLLEGAIRAFHRDRTQTSMDMPFPRIGLTCDVWRAQVCAQHEHVPFYSLRSGSRSNSNTLGHAFPSYRIDLQRVEIPGVSQRVTL